MDFGLGRYLEMFEERFGHKATTGLIIFLTIGLAAVLVPLIWKNLWEPIYGAALSVMKGGLGSYFAGLTLREVLSFSFSLTVLFGSGTMLLGTWQTLFDPKYRLEVRRVERLRLRAMKGRARPQSVRSNVLRTILLSIPVVALAALLIYIAVSTGIAITQMATLGPQVAKESERADRLFQVASGIKQKLATVEAKANATIRINDRLTAEYRKMCQSAGKSSVECELAISNITSEAKGLPGEYPQVPMPQAPQARKSPGTSP